MCQAVGTRSPAQLPPRAAMGYRKAMQGLRGDSGALLFAQTNKLVIAPFDFGYPRSS
jgi:hypothetical protein